jgi:tRNA dimethylallyltransferase
VQVPVFRPFAEVYLKRRFSEVPAVFAVGVEMAETPSILAILGPTASGKSALAMDVCRRIGGEILSVDSMQVYREMDIGTAKPTAAERAQVRHHLIDLVAPNEPFTVARFVELADAVIADARLRGVPLVVTGGTPLYYKALFEGLFEGPGADETIRAKLREKSGEELFRRLQEVDPAAATRIHANDQKRLVRALEVFELTGQPISSFQTHWEEQNPPRHAAAWVGLDWDREVLNRRINARTRAMLEAGWLEEVRGLLRRYGSLSQTAAEATGYAELIAHVQGKMALDETTEQIKIGTRQLARRQMKWLRRFPNVRWLRGDQPLEVLMQEALAAIEQ